MPHTPRILIVEDNVEDRELLIWQLRKINIESAVRFISDGRDALEFLVSLNNSGEGHLVVALFLDLKLPTLNGLDLLNKLRELPHFQELPVIIMTSSIDPRDREECLRLRVKGFIAKPITFATFSKAVADVFFLPRMPARSGNSQT
jgi:CheY-like chemotaxis protein